MSSSLTVKAANAVCLHVVPATCSPHPVPLQPVACDMLHACMRVSARHTCRSSRGSFTAFWMSWLLLTSTIVCCRCSGSWWQSSGVSSRLGARFCAQRWALIVFVIQCHIERNRTSVLWLELSGTRDCVPVAANSCKACTSVTAVPRQ